MAVRVVPGPSRIRWALVGFLAVVGLFGCNRQRTQLPNPSGGNPPAADTTAGIDTRLTKSFEEAITENPLPDWIPEATTSTGKSIGKLYTDVQRLWKEIPFTTPDGKPISYRATLETDLGSLEIAFFPNLAPNHVRNFVALARAGYYDGLVFERIISINQETDPDVLKGEQLDYIEGGGPLGPIKPAYDSLGYWLSRRYNLKSATKRALSVLAVVRRWTARPASSTSPWANLPHPSTAITPSSGRWLKGLTLLVKYIVNLWWRIQRTTVSTFPRSRWSFVR